MHKKKRFTLAKRLVIVLLIFPINLFADTPGSGIDDLANIGKIIPPSPTAAALAKYGEIPVNYANGTPEISIPIWNVSIGNLSVPISLSYYASGNKIDDIASWVGLGWSLNAGGVISRSVNGQPDELSVNTFLGQCASIPNRQFNEDNTSDFNYLQSIANGTIETQPDIFTFNFGKYCGQFVFGNDAKIHLIPNSALNISYTFGSGGITSFTIKTEDGTTYVFDQVEVSTVMEQISKNSQTYNSSWYLGEIISADNSDIIYFSYKAHYNVSYDIQHGSSERCLISQSGTPGATACGQFNFRGNCDGESTSVSTISFNPALKLSQIISRNSRIRFYSSSNRLDLDNEYKLDSISISSHNQTISQSDIKTGIDIKWITEKRIHAFQFFYSYFISDPVTAIPENNNRLRLDWLLDNVVNEYSFDYNSTSLPPRFSKSKDFWGYYNGANNSTLIPATYFDGVDMGGANRFPNATFCQAGMLQTIHYPTGGYTRFTFESNDYLPDNTYSSDLISYTHKSINVTSYGIKGVGPNSKVPGDDGSVCNYNIILPSGAINGHLNAHLSQCLSVTGIAQPFGTQCYDYLGNFIFSKDKDEVCSAASITFPNGGTQNYYSYTGVSQDYYYHDLSAGQYNLCAYAYFSPQIGADLTFEWDQPSYLNSGKNIAGGLRIKEISNFDGTKFTNKVFKYELSDNSGRSSGHLTLVPSYSFLTATQEKDACSSDLCCGYCEKEYLNRSSGSNIGSIAYTNVTIFDDENGQNGKTENTYTYADDMGGTVYPFCPVSNLGEDRGKLKTSKIYNWNATLSSFTPVSKIENSYQLGNGATIMGLNVGYKNHIVCQGVAGSFVGTFNWQFFYFYSFLYQLSQTAKTTYDLSGNNPITETENFEYDPTYLQLLRTTKYRSDGFKVITQYIYPYNYLGTSGFINDMKTENILNKPVETVTYQTDASNGNVKIISGSIITYKTGSSLGLPDKIWKLETTAPISLYNFSFTNAGINGILPKDIVNPVAFSLSSKDSHYPINENEAITYNNNNIIQVDVNNNISTSYLWGYNNAYPIAKVVNATTSQIAYTSFEDGFPSGWVQTSGNISAYSGSNTGRNEISNGSIQSPSLPAGTYVVSFWARGNTSTPNATIYINGNNSGINPDENTGGRYQTTVTLSAASRIIIGFGNIELDEVRIYPSGAQMTTYTYDPLIGMTSSTDENNVTTYYYYDAFGRLSDIKDSDGKVLKHYEYHYKQ